MTRSGQVDQAGILAAKNAERLVLPDFLDTLDEQDWQAASLCPGWTVRDVVAHVTLATRQTVLPTIGRVLRARGDFNRVNREWACGWAAPDLLLLATGRAAGLSGLNGPGAAHAAARLS